MVNSIVTEIFVEFKKNTGLLYPLTKFLLSNVILISALIIIPFKVLFWVYEIGYLSVFGLNHDLLIRTNLEAQSLWSALFISFSDWLISPVWVFLTICISLGCFAFFRGCFFCYRRIKKIKKRKITKKKQHNEIRKTWRVLLNIYVKYLNRRELKTFAIAKTSHSISLLLLVFISGLVFSSKWIYEQGQELAQQRLELFIDENLCIDGWGQTGCYTIESNNEIYKGYLVAFNNEKYYLLEGRKILLINNTPNTVLSRDFIYSSVDEKNDQDIK